MKKQICLLLALALLLSAPSNSGADQVVVSLFTGDEPVLDGLENEKSWPRATPVITRDLVAGIPVTLKTLHSSDKIFFLVRFPDQDESRTHKSWKWDKGRNIYTVGNDIEDIFVFKWSLADSLSELSIYAGSPSKTDVWFWKACRTDPVGYADDKLHILSRARMKDATELTSRSGTLLYLMRKEDSGRKAYRTKMPGDYKAENLPRYINQTPSGSRADIKAKGNWHKGVWTIEFSRALHTGDKDDVQFNIGAEYLFGVSRYEIAGREKNPKLTQPFYGVGDTGEKLTLTFSSN